MMRIIPVKERDQRSGVNQYLWHGFLHSLPLSDHAFFPFPDSLYGPS
jgi:hypothetical protein